MPERIVLIKFMCEFSGGGELLKKSQSDLPQSETWWQKNKDSVMISLAILSLEKFPEIIFWIGNWLMPFFSRLLS